MKNVRIWALLLGMSLLAAACGTGSGLSKNGTAEKALVEQFCKGMIDEAEDGELWPMISPKYMADNGLSKSKYNVNVYYPEAYKILSYDAKTGLIVSEIAGEGWAHELTWKVVKEDGKLYLWPGKHTAEYIHPWYEVKTYINEK